MRLPTICDPSDNRFKQPEHKQAGMTDTCCLQQLPLSFFTSYFGMNVVEFTGDQGNTNQGEVWKIMGPISFGITFSLLGIGWLSKYQHP